MKAGVLGIGAGDFRRIDSFLTTRQQDETELKTRVEVTGVRQTPDGLTITEGRAAAERLTETESVQLEGASLLVSAETEKTTQYTEFASVSGEFIVVTSGAGTFLFDALSDRFEATVGRASIDLDAVVATYPDATPWKVGFYGHSDSAQNGVIHGESVLEDSVFGGALASISKNQLGLEFDHDGAPVKMAVTQSGYIEVYQPSNYGTAEFADFVQDVILPHAAFPDD